MTTTSIKALAAKATRENLAFDPKNLPVKVGLWYLFVAPIRPPKESAGGIALPDDARRAEDHLISVGKIMDMGDFAYTAKTQGGLDLSTDTRKPAIGDYVLYQQYAGTRVTLKDGRMFIILTDTEIFGVVPPDQVSQLQFYL